MCIRARNLSMNSLPPPIVERNVGLNKLSDSVLRYETMRLVAPLYNIALRTWVCLYSRCNERYYTNVELSVLTSVHQMIQSDIMNIIVFDDLWNRWRTRQFGIIQCTLGCPSIRLSSIAPWVTFTPISTQLNLTNITYYSILKCRIL